MRILKIILMTTAAVVLPGVALADSPNFMRDRNIPVSDRHLPGAQERTIGSFIIAPTLEVGGILKDNVYYSHTGKVGDFVLDVKPAVKVVSNWGRHQVKAAVDLDYNQFLKYTGENTLTGSVAVGGRYDFARYTSLAATAAYSRNFEPRFDPSPVTAAPGTVGAPARPIRFDSAAAGVNFTTVLNRLKIVANSDFRTLNYHDAPAIGGGIIDQDYRDYDNVTTGARFEYAVSPDTSIFFNGNAINNDYKVKTNDHSSTGYNYAIGASFDLTNLMTGEVQYGYLNQNYKNPAFKTVSGASYRAKVNYFPTQLMTVTVNASRSIEETPQVNVSGYIKTVAGISVNHELTRLIILSASLEKNKNKYNGIDRLDDRSSINLGVKYSIAKNMAVKAGYVYRDMNSKGTAALTNYKENSLNVYLSYSY